MREGTGALVEPQERANSTEVAPKLYSSESKQLWATSPTFSFLDCLSAFPCQCSHWFGNVLGAVGVVQIENGDPLTKLWRLIFMQVEGWTCTTPIHRPKQSWPKNRLFSASVRLHWYSPCITSQPTICDQCCNKGKNSRQFAQSKFPQGRMWQWLFICCNDGVTREILARPLRTVLLLYFAIVFFERRHFLFHIK